MGCTKGCEKKQLCSGTFSKDSQSDSLLFPREGRERRLPCSYWSDGYNRAAGFGVEIPCACTGFMAARPTKRGSRTFCCIEELY